MEVNNRTNVEDELPHPILGHYTKMMKHVIKEKVEVFQKKQSDGVEKDEEMTKLFQVDQKLLN